MEKSPLGLIPRRIRDEQTLKAIHAAIIGHIETETPVPDEWLEEYTDIVTRWSFEDGREVTNDLPVDENEAVNDAPVETRQSRYTRYLDELYVRGILSPEKYLEMSHNPEGYSSYINDLRHRNGMK